MEAVRPDEPDRQLRLEDLTGLGFKDELAGHMIELLEDEDILERYLERGAQLGCEPLSRISPDYPMSVRNRLGMDAPGCLWVKGNPDLLKEPAVSLVGSRDLRPENEAFAKEVGRQAALQGYTLVSGNARGADRIAQDSCLAQGGSVISIVADQLTSHRMKDHVLYIAEDGYDLEFTSHRALSRNRLIHSWSDKVFVAQCTYGKGGTWDGTSNNLRRGFSQVFCLRDGSRAALELEQMGAACITTEALEDISAISGSTISFLD
jgi:predicted Rossmann fold nucleotide-binding protein DprA/Smf involved in DNA uptake